MYSLPNLKNRYEYSQGKEDKYNVEVIPTVGERSYEPCLGECGAMVAPGQKCVPCAVKAVEEWKAEHDQRKAMPKVRRASASKPNRRRRS